MNKKALGLSALGLLVFTAPAFAQDKDKPASTKTGSSYSSEPTTKSDDTTQSTTDKEKATKKAPESGMTTGSSSTSKQTEGTGGSGSKKKEKEKTETESSGKVTEEKK